MKIAFTLAAGFGLVALLAAPAFAQSGELDQALGEMARGQGDAYTAARARVVALGEPARHALEARLASATWTEESFPELAAATIAESYLAHPDLVKRVNHLEGLDASKYLLRRRPEPECGRELVRLGADAVGPVLELTLKTFDRYAFSTAETVPAPARARVEELAAKERIALREGLVIALAESRHPAARFVCQKVARDAKEPEAARLQAAEGLGTLATADALSDLVALHDDAATPSSVRLAAIRGAARVPTAEALAFLEKQLESATADERRVAVVALGAFGSVHGWEARGDAARATGEGLRRSAALRLVEIVRTGAPVVPAEAVVDALGTIAHPDALAPLDEIAQDAQASPGARALAKRAHERLRVAVERNAK